MMETIFWQTQNYNSPLFKDILWNKPEQKSLSGKLLIIGGNSLTINAPNKAYTAAKAQGVGEIIVALPDKAKKILGINFLPNIEFLPSTSIGGFSQKSVDILTNYMTWANATLFAGDLGRNSETAVVLEKLLDLTNIQVLTLDAIDYFTNNANFILDKPNILMVISLTQLQKYVQNAKFMSSINSSMDLLKLCSLLKKLTSFYASSIIVQHKQNIICASNSKVIVTKMPNITIKDWQIKTAAAASVWWLQNPKSPLKAFATSITQIKL